MMRPRIIRPSLLRWIGLVAGPAEQRPYHPDYAAAKWRSWRAFGSGIIGDFGCHTGNLMFGRSSWSSCGIPRPPTRETHRAFASKPCPPKRNEEGYPRSMQAVLDLPARGELPPVRLTVKRIEPALARLDAGHPQGNWGDLLVGANGSIYSDNP